MLQALSKCVWRSHNAKAEVCGVLGESSFSNFLSKGEIVVEYSVFVVVLIFSVLSFELLISNETQASMSRFSSVWLGISGGKYGVGRDAMVFGLVISWGGVGGFAVDTNGAHCMLLFIHREQGLCSSHFRCDVKYVCYIIRTKSR
jgi:hypothetical protein